MDNVSTSRQRRRVSVPFLDVAGSTAMTRELDPGDVADIIDNALACFSDVVRDHVCRVLKYAGDSVLAAFGADRSRADDAKRPVRDGPALLQASREHAARVQRERGQDGFDVRAGVHTGHPIMGGSIDADGSRWESATSTAASQQ